MLLSIQVLKRNVIIEQKAKLVPLSDEVLNRYYVFSKYTWKWINNKLKFTNKALMFHSQGESPSVGPKCISVASMIQEALQFKRAVLETLTDFVDPQKNFIWNRTVIAVPRMPVGFKGNAERSNDTHNLYREICYQLNSLLYSKLVEKKCLILTKERQNVWTLIFIRVSAKI